MAQQEYEEQLRAKSEILAEKINSSADPERKNQLIQKLVTLFKNGFDENLFHQMDPKFFVEKGFSISEALLISKNEEYLHPTLEEIQRLVKDDDTNLLKLEYIEPRKDNSLNYYYIIVIGPTNRGKTTVIFNLINSLYNINIDSLYRVKKLPNQSDEYFDEYLIQISETVCYVFVDFKGIGDVKLDFLGLDLTGRNNLFTNILQYLENKQILSILYVNSSSINRLGYEEQYQLQRFFEILPKSYYQKVYFILTYCTDNTPLLNIYCSPDNTSVPQQMKDLMKRKPEELTKELKFWFGINNAYLYEKIDYRKQKEYEENNQIDIQAVIDGQPYLDIEIQREEGATLEQQINDNNQEQKQEIDIPLEDLPKIYYNQMVQITKEVLQKIRLQNSIPYSQSDTKTFRNMLNFEKELIKLLLIKNKQAKLGFPNRIIDGEKKSVYLQYVTQKQEGESDKKKSTRRGTKCLFCVSCNKPCHETCYMNNFSELQQKTKICRKLVDNSGTTQKQIDLSELVKLISCKKCFKNQQKKCTLETHQLMDHIPADNVISIGKIETQINQEFSELFLQKKKDKKVLRLEQSNAFKNRRGYLSQVEKILQENQNLDTQEDRLTKINLSTRTTLINAIYEQLTKNQQEENSEYLTKLNVVKVIYNRIAPPPPPRQLGQTQMLNTNQLNDQVQPVAEEKEYNQFEPPAESPMSFNNDAGPLRNYKVLAGAIANNSNIRKHNQQQQQININQQNQDGSPSRRNPTDNGSVLFHLGQEQSPLILQRRDSAQ